MNGPLTLAVGTLSDVEELLQAELLLSAQALLVELQFPQALVLLVPGGAGVLHQVQPRLGGVVTQRAVVHAGLWAEGAVLLLQVLREAKEESG